MVRSKRVKILATLLACALAGCAKRPASSGSAAKPAMVEARVITMHTALEPGGRALDTEILVSGSLVRLGNELDRWRLFDLDRNEVVLVDEVDHTYRRLTLGDLVAQKRALLKTVTPPVAPQMRGMRSGRTMAILGIPSHEWAIVAGGYRRALWLSDKPLIGARFAPLFVLSEPAGGPYPARTASLQLQLAADPGFPVADRSEMVVGNDKWVVDRRFLREAKKRVPQSLFVVPSEFKDVTPKAPEAR